jgi:hypothetical protein
MKTFPRLALACALAALATGCKTAADFQRNNTTTADWLHANAGPPGMNVAGDWDSPDWGEGHFKQVGNRVTGILDDYPVGGVLNGKKLYLAITDNGWTDYTAVLAQQYDGSLAGMYSGKVPFTTGDEEQIELKRSRP